MRVSTFPVVAAALCAAAIVNAQPRLGAVMTLSGVPGTITIQADRTDWSQIEGMSDPGTTRPSGTGSTLSSRSGSLLTSRGSSSSADRGRVGAQDFTITKEVDSATPKLNDLLASGEHIREVRLELEHAGGSARERVVITMRNAVITRIEEETARGTERPTEAVTFRCDAIEWESQPTTTTWRATPPPLAPTPRP